MAFHGSAVWLDGETLTVAYATDAVAQCCVAREFDLRWLREVGELRVFAIVHASPLPFLPNLTEWDRRPVQRLAPH